MTTSSPAINQRCNYIAIVGAPNAGKSTLINALVGSKISIVTPKVQTTRTLVRGICMMGETQLVFIDTPGIFSPKKPLEKAMVRTAWLGAKDGDLTLLLIDATHGLSSTVQEIINTLKQKKARTILALNKIDKIKPEILLALTKECTSHMEFEKVFMISALRQDGLEDLKHYLAETAPEGPWLFPEDQLSDAPSRLLAAEITREQLFLQLNHEVPYMLCVDTEHWEQDEAGILTIHQIIYVQRESQKMIVIGEKGQRLKQVGMKSRKLLSKLFETGVRLFLHVKVKEDWTEKPHLYSSLGLNFPTE